MIYSINPCETPLLIEYIAIRTFKAFNAIAIARIQSFVWIGIEVVEGLPELQELSPVSSARLLIITELEVEFLLLTSRIGSSVFLEALGFIPFPLLHASRASSWVSAWVVLFVFLCINHVSVFNICRLSILIRLQLLSLVFMGGASPFRYLFLEVLLVNHIIPWSLLILFFLLTRELFFQVDFLWRVLLLSGDSFQESRLERLAVVVVPVHHRPSLVVQALVNFVVDFCWRLV